jgi:hypothetical protein
MLKIRYEARSRAGVCIVHGYPWKAWRIVSSMPSAPHLAMLQHVNCQLIQYCAWPNLNLPCRNTPASFDAAHSFLLCSRDISHN